MGERSVGRSIGSGEDMRVCVSASACAHVWMRTRVRLRGRVGGGNGGGTSQACRDWIGKKIRKKAMSNKRRRRKKKCDMVEGGREAEREIVYMGRESGCDSGM